MAKRIKSLEDISRLAEIKRNITDSLMNIKTLKATVKALKTERKEIKAKYVKAYKLFCQMA